MTSVLAAISLIVAVFAIADTLLESSTRLMIRTTSTLGLFSAAFFFCNGVLRIQTPGTLDYIAGLNHDWGESAYLVVQIAGTQGLASAGIFALSAWAICLSVIGWHSQKIPQALSWLGILPALPWIMGLLGRLLPLPDSVWLLYIGSIALGIPLWCILLGIVLLRRQSPDKG